ncbi:MAG: carbonic anhydrase fused with sulfate permease [Streptosporangiaceae bacterium]|nr:carbonic anhydrase fused with sulfate permease [Streptosporangiaceae bacterium]
MSLKQPLAALRRRCGLGLPGRGDVLASLVVLLVAVPLSLGIAVATGAPLAAGLVAAVVGGVVAGGLGGSVVQVSGPAAGLVVVVADLIARYGWAATCAITAMAGAMQILLGFCRIARMALAVSPAIVHGMLAGVGCVIATAQIHIVLGGKPQSALVSNIAQLPAQIAEHHKPDVLVGVATIVLMLVWPRLPSPVRRVPAPLAAIVLVTAGAVVGRLDVEKPVLPGRLLAGQTLARLPDGSVLGIAFAVITVAMVAGVESLLSAVAVDRLHRGKRADLNRELLGQGGANVVSGLCGGLPVSGVIVRSTVNATSGATSRWSAVLHGVWVLVFVAAFAGLLRQIPLSALAGLLVVVGLRLVDLGGLSHLHRHRELPTYAVSLAGVIFLGLLEGVALGIAVAVATALWRITRVSIELQDNDRYWHVTVHGSMIFLSVPRLAGELGRIPPGHEVILDLDVDFIDHAAFEALRTWMHGYRQTGGQVQVNEVAGDVWSRALTAAPVRHRQPPASRHRWPLPWSHTQRQEAGIGRRAVAAAQGGEARLLAGIAEFQRRRASQLRPVLSELAEDGQAPKVLFITCADARVVPSLITASGPGDLFTIRNVGNLVPVHDPGRPAAEAAVGAGIEYGVDVLGVETIVVCGHSRCGAVQALAESPSLPPQVVAWLRHGVEGLSRGELGAHTPLGHTLDSSIEGLALSNVAAQLANLHTYPSVRAGVATGRLRLVGMYFDLATAQTLVLDPDTQMFRPVEDPCTSTPPAPGTGRAARPAG